MKFYPPRPDSPDLKDIEIPKGKNLKKSEASKRYIMPTIKREKENQTTRRSKWFWEKGLPLLNLFLALIAAITGVISLTK